MILLVCDGQHKREGNTMNRYDNPITLTRRGEMLVAWTVSALALVVFVAVCYVETVPN